ncbi:hypothetical protein [Cryobacterium sp. CG_9.6]|uniref:hypothetical protein n=1 Tax=Cryobacterium sp. CG_9.6 TaxID=2760710 RepID=UPI0024771020|nr:hypothetical protein [Cryobacterium sp. CG_9.6]MDH6237442.1 hypothetical protein [Cryobacterium sp. CG_9.6]
MNDRDDDPPGMERHMLPELPNWLKKLSGKVVPQVSGAGKKAKSRMLTGIGFQLFVGIAIHLLNTRR